uniref:Uncharacterized protein n=1 Tax=Haemophilus influenzae TaxID=727 RepID=A0A5B8RIZ7_HAEIF|nr:hypothetical protein [Haemophilus influenzae]
MYCKVHFENSQWLATFSLPEPTGETMGALCVNLMPQI